MYYGILGFIIGFFAALVIGSILAYSLTHDTIKKSYKERNRGAGNPVYPSGQLERSQQED